MKIDRLISGALAMALLAIQPNAAFATDKAAGWEKWTARAEAIDAALKSENEMPALKTACTGVTGTVIGQGFQFPGWGMALIQVCTYTKDNWLYTRDRKGARRQCSDIKGVIKQLNNATPVAEAPRADAVARSIAATLQEGVTKLC